MALSVEIICKWLQSHHGCVRLRLVANHVDLLAGYNPQGCHAGMGHGHPPEIVVNVSRVPGSNRALSGTPESIVRPCAHYFNPCNSAYAYLQCGRTA